MPFNSQGQWVTEDDSVANKLNSLTSSSSPYIKLARASGAATANRRGLLNSSMAAGAAEGAAIGAALPIASQEAQQIAVKNQQYQQAGYTMDQQKVVTASADRTAALAAAMQAQQNYTDAFVNLAQNKDIPAATRDSYIKELQTARSTGLDLIQQFYGINLNWGQGGVSTGNYGVVPTNKDGIQGGGGGY